MIKRLDQVSEWTNPFLMIAAAYLLILDLSLFAAFEISRLPAVRSDEGGRDVTSVPLGAAAPGTSRAGALD